MAGLTLPTAIPSITIGGRVFTDLANLKILSGYSTNATNCRFTPAEQKSTVSTAGYQVPVGKRFNVQAVRITLTASTASNGERAMRINYADNDVGALGTATAFTNEVATVGGAVIASALGAGGAALSTPVYEKACSLWIPAQKYLACQGELASTVLVEIYGYEVPA